MLRSFKRILGRTAILACAVAMLGAMAPAHAQEVSDTHLRAARSVLTVLKTTQEFDAVLPEYALNLKTELIQKNPDLQEVISRTVDETALALAARRADLEREAAIAYARFFTEEELNEIAEFYGSDTGQKLLTDGVVVLREIFQAGEIWQNGIARDLAVQVAERLEETAPAAFPPDGVTETETETEDSQ